MKDTSPKMEEVYRKLLMSRSGSERLKMASDMFDTARALARANLLNEGFSDGEIRKELFLRTYRSDFDPATIQKILSKLIRTSKKS